MECLAVTQLQLTGISVEVGFEGRDRNTVRVGIVNAEATSHVDMFYADAVVIKYILKFVDTIAECLEVTHVEYLGADMEVESDELYILQLLGFGDDCQHIVHIDAELVLCQTRGNVGVGMGTDIGIQTEGDAGHLSLSGCQLIDNLEFWDALYIEAEDIVVDTQIDLPVALSHAGKDNLGYREAGLDRCLDLTSTDAICSEACLTDDAQYFRIGISLDGIVYYESLVARGLFVDGAKSLA